MVEARAPERARVHDECVRQAARGDPLHAGAARRARRGDRGGGAVGRAEGAEVDPANAIGELELAHDTLGSSMQRDIAAGRTPELDAIPGSVLRAAARHDLQCPTIERLVALIAVRAGSLVPAVKPRCVGRFPRRPGAVARQEGDFAGLRYRGRRLGSPGWRRPLRPAPRTRLPSSCSPSQSTLKFPVTPLSAWIVMPGRTSSPSSSPRRSRSKCARPMPLAVCVGFSRS